MAPSISTKRANELEDVEQLTKQLKPEASNKGHTYQGYRLSEKITKLDRVSINDLDYAEFQKKYVLAHRPCIIEGIIPELDANQFELDALEETLLGTKKDDKDDDDDDDETQELLQVESKVEGGFGSGRKRLRMTFQEFVGRLKSQSNEDLYLTTQYSENEQEPDEEEEEDDDDVDEENEKGYLEGTAEFSETESIDMNNLRDDFVDSDQEEGDLNDDENEDEEENGEERDLEDPRAILQPPLRTLYKTFPISPALLSNLIPQQINLWIGSTKSGYNEVKLDEEKPHLGIGKNLPFTNGISSGLHHDHSDNLYIPITGKKRFTLFSPYDVESLYTVGDVYKVYENGVIDYEINENAPNWKHVRSDGVIIDDDAETPRVITDKDPPSFSKIPPYYIHLDDCKDAKMKEQLLKDFQTHYPKATSLNKCEVELERGQMLFLPCGWFHEVTSFGTEENHGVHVALNYWFIPPDNESNASNPYKNF